MNNNCYRIELDDLCDIKLREFIDDLKNGELIFEAGVLYSAERTELTRRCNELFSEYTDYGYDHETIVEQIGNFLLAFEVLEPAGTGILILRNLIIQRRITHNNIDKIIGFLEKKPPRPENYVRWYIREIANKPTDERIMWFLNQLYE